MSDLSDIAADHACDECRSATEPMPWRDPISFAAGADWAVTWLVALVQMGEAIRENEYKDDATCEATCDECGAPSGKACKPYCAVEIQNARFDRGVF